MKIEQNTQILSLVREFPFLIEALAEHNKTFEKLRNPILRQTIGRVATIEKAAFMGKENILDLMLFIAGKIMAATGRQLEIVPPQVDEPVASIQVMSDEERMESLKKIILALHEGEDMDKLQEQFKATVGDISPEEIAALEQSLVDDGLAESEIKKMCDLHVELFQGSLETQKVPAMPPGHPVHTYMEENRYAKEITSELLRELDRMGDNPQENIWSFSVNNLRTQLKELEGIITHYVRKENQLFPMLERHGIEAPPKVMWEVHDDIRAKYRLTDESFQASDPAISVIHLRELVKTIDDMIIKEEQILFPMALETLSEEDWSRARRGDDEIGYAFDVTPGDQWKPSAPTTKDDFTDSDLINLATGKLPLEVVNLMLCNLPVDMSFVDVEGKVAYYSDSSHRIFPRSPEVIGRDVKNCHPSKSVKMVTDILEAFKNGERKQAEFWLELGGKFIHIQYLALHSADGKYLGCLEVGQDATYVRSLEGQRRLLEWS